MRYKKFAVLKLFFLIIALGCAIFLVFLERGSNVISDRTLVFVVDMNKTMNTQDVLSGDTKISRLAAAKYLIKNIILSHPGYTYGLIMFNTSTEYLVPPTFDTGTFFLYMMGMTTNLLPDGPKNFAALSGVLLYVPSVSYVVFSDFDGITGNQFTFPSSTYLIGLGSVSGDSVRYPNGIRYYDRDGNAVFSARNDAFAKLFGRPYLALDQVTNFSTDIFISKEMYLSFTHRMFLYVLLGVLVIAAIML